jgi:hypothetical protein
MDDRPLMGHGSPSRMLLVAAGSVAAGVHAGLAPDHLHEWAPLGVAFIAAAAISGLGAAAVVVRPADPWSTRALVAVLAGLAAAYVATRLVALPPLDPDREALDATGVVAVAVESLGVLAGLRLGTSPAAPRAPRLTLDQGESR